MSGKVIYVSFVHLSDKTSRDWYVDYLISKGIAVEYWDIVALVREQYVESNAKSADYLRIVKTYSELEEMLRLPENKNARYIMLVNYAQRAIKLFRLLSKYDCRMFFIAWVGMPFKSVKKWQSILLSACSDPWRLIEKIYYRLKGVAYRKLKLVKPFDIVFAAGNVLATRKFYAGKVVPINLVDYDHYLKIRSENARLVADRYAVFLDINLPYQSDLKLAGMHAVNPHNYYASLNRFFGLVELQYGIRVVVAAHPKADCSVNQFNSREVYSGRTPELVKDADFVISHHSASLSYAVLNNKPMVFVYTDEIEAIYRHTMLSYICDLAEFFDAALFNMDDALKGKKIALKNVNVGRYEKFKYDYLTTLASEKTTTQEIFLREISA